METINDILKEMKGANFQPPMYQVWVNEYADRIEAAHKRESVTDCNALNGAKMREALEQINRIVWDKKRHTKEETEAHRLATEALTAPPRNCDVGTEGEQSRRFDKFCYAHKRYERGCGDCPLFLAVCCELAWSQMPYEKGGAK